MLAQGPALLPDHLTWWGQFKQGGQQGSQHASNAVSLPVAVATPQVPVAPASADPEPIVDEPSGNGDVPAAGSGVPWDVDVENPLEEAERATLKLILNRCQWNFKKAAERLRLSRSTLYAKVSRYGLQRE